MDKQIWSILTIKWYLALKKKKTMTIDEPWGYHDMWNKPDMNGSNNIWFIFYEVPGEIKDRK